MRINKYLAQAGLGSRRKVEELIAHRKIRVNGQIVRDLSTQIKGGDIVKYNSHIVKKRNNKIYLLINKPAGYTSTHSDPHALKTVMELVEDKNLFPVGRLDRDSRGLMILTNDGDFAQRLSHPRYSHEKEYEVSARKPSDNCREKIERVMRYFKCGTVISKNYKTQPAQIKMTRCRQHQMIFRIVLKEGKKRQIRQIFAKAGLEVTDLLRVRIDKYELGDLREGETRPLTNTKL